MSAREVRNLELLKKRFGDGALQSCEVMLRDIAESKRVTQAVHRHRRVHWFSSHHLAGGDLKVQRLVEAVTTILENKILASHTDVCASKPDIGWHVGTAHQQQLHSIYISIKQELSTFFYIFIIQSLDYLWSNVFFGPNDKSFYYSSTG